MPQDKEMVLKENHLDPSDCISCNHYLSPVPGVVVASLGYTSACHGVVGGTIYVDHASGFIFHRPQRTINANDTIRGKLLLEREAAGVGITIKAYHSDNGVFNSKAFKDHCEELGQKLTFSGVGAHHQNGVAERAIQTISNMARANMIHAALSWPDRSFITYWPLAMSYAIWVYNQMPPNGYGWAPEEIWTRTKAPRSGLTRSHVFGCPV
jgi:transposase InsO family protein